MSGITFDPAPLLRQVELSTQRVADEQVASLLGVSREQVLRWRHGQRLYPRTAEKVAVAAGFLPCELWPEWYDAAIAGLGVTCPVCSTVFVPARPQSHQRFCSVKCRRSQPRERERAAEAKRRYRRTKGAEANRERRRAYYAANAEYERARQRRWYWQQKEAS